MIKNINFGIRKLKDVGEDNKMELQITLAYPALDDNVFHMKIAVKLDNKIMEYEFF